jgi:hypothetical protein
MSSFPQTFFIDSINTPWKQVSTKSNIAPYEKFTVEQHWGICGYTPGTGPGTSQFPGLKPVVIV